MAPTPIRAALLSLALLATATAADAKPAKTPAVAEVAWDLRIPADPDPSDVAFVDGWIAKLPGLANDSAAMGDCIATLMTEENWPKAYPRLCRALADPGFKDLFGPCEIILELYRSNRKAEANRLFAFVAKASERCTDPGDLSHFALACLSVRERKAIPRLIEMLTGQDKDLRDVAGEAIAVITGLPRSEAVVPEKAQAWWVANRSRSTATILAEQLKSPDPNLAVEAAAGLCELRNAAIFPVLFKLLRGNDAEIGRRAITVVLRATGRDWQYDPVAKPEERAARVDLMEKWWREEHLRFSWPGLPRDESPAAAAAAAPPDPLLEEVNRLGSAKQTEVQQADAALRRRALEAVPALLVGLDAPSLLVRRRSFEILRDITRHNLPFDPRADADARTAAIAAWRDWAVGKKLIAGEAPAAKGGE